LVSIESRTRFLITGQTSIDVWHRSRLSGSVTLHSQPAGGFTRAGQAMASCHLLSNYSSTATLHSRPFVLRPVRTTPC